MVLSTCRIALTVELSEFNERTWLDNKIKNSLMEDEFGDDAAKEQIA